VSTQNSREAFDRKVQLTTRAEPMGRSCLSSMGNPKRRYPTKRAAKEYLKKWQALYQCPDCQQWHVTTK
jgi:hypothetical protein